MDREAAESATGKDGTEGVREPVEDKLEVVVQGKVEEGMRCWKRVGRAGTAGGRRGDG